MITALALLVVADQTFPKGTSFEYSGIPVVKGSNSVRTISHNVRFVIGKLSATANSLTLFKNDSAAPVHCTIRVPRYRLSPKGGTGSDFTATAIWNKATLTLTPDLVANDTGDDETDVILGQWDLVARVDLKAKETASLKLTFATPTGVTGYAQTQRITGYQMPPSGSIGQVNIAFGYSQRDVFNLPTLGPADWKWQVGRTGSFIRQSDFSPKGELVTFAYFKSGF